VRNMTWLLNGAQLVLKFRLHRGAFATAILAELLGTSASELGEMEEG